MQRFAHPDAKESDGSAHMGFDTVLWALAKKRDRRSAFVAVVASAFALLSSGVVAKRKNKKKKDQSSGCSDNHSEDQILGYIGKASKRYNQSRSAMERVARCESNLDPCAVNREGPYYGLYQFLKSTWKTTPYGNENIYDPEAQALAAGWMWSEGRKNEWACK
jgi:hypothetical protein